MSRIQPGAFAASKLKQRELPRPVSAKQAKLFQASFGNSDVVELESFLATATAIKTLLGQTAVNEQWRSLRFTPVANDAAASTTQKAASTQRAASARPSYRRPSNRPSAEEQLTQARAAAEAAIKQRFSKSCEESDRLAREMDAARANSIAVRELDYARAKQRSSRKPGATWSPEMAMCAASSQGYL